VPGRQPIPIWLTIVIGIVAAFIGAFIAGALGYANGGIPWVLLPAGDVRATPTAG
jgi:uncharacterized membrane protein YeaQ/YmgE (transglycosylase-associated protein family)